MLLVSSSLQFRRTSTVTTNPEHPADRLARMFNMGKYGENLAKEILGQYKHMIEEALEDAGYARAADYVWREFEPTFELDGD